MTHGWFITILLPPVPTTIKVFLPDLLPVKTMPRAKMNLFATNKLKDPFITL